MGGITGGDPFAPYLKQKGYAVDKNVRISFAITGTKRKKDIYLLKDRIEIINMFLSFNGTDWWQRDKWVPVQCMYVTSDQERVTS